MKSTVNTPGTRGGPGGRDRTLAVKRRVTPEVGQKQKTEKKKERWESGDNNGELRIGNATSGGARKAAWVKREKD